MTAQGLDNIRSALGKPLTGVRRFVLGLGRSSDAFGHGITELSFEDVHLVIRPGPNEDYLVVQRGDFDATTLDLEYWTAVSLVGAADWVSPRGRLASVDVFTDGVEDVGLVFRFDTGEQFAVLLCDTDLMIAQDLEPFEKAPDQVSPRFRERI